MVAGTVGCKQSGHMLIRSVEEIATGIDEVLGDILASRRARFGASLHEAAEATGASVEELVLLEDGEIGAFADLERLRRVILAVSDYLDMDPAPLLARLEIYAPRQGLDLHRLLQDQNGSAGGPAWAVPACLALTFVAVFLGGLVLLLLVDRL